MSALAADELEETLYLNPASGEAAQGQPEGDTGHGDELDVTSCGGLPACDRPACGSELDVTSCVGLPACVLPVCELPAGDRPACGLPPDSLTRIPEEEGDPSSAGSIAPEQGSRGSSASNLDGLPPSVLLASSMRARRAAADPGGLLRGAIVEAPGACGDPLSVTAKFGTDSLRWQPRGWPPFADGWEPVEPHPLLYASLSPKSVNSPTGLVAAQRSHIDAAEEGPTAQNTGQVHWLLRDQSGANERSALDHGPPPDSWAPGPWAPGAGDPAPSFGPMEVSFSPAYPNVFLQGQQPHSGAKEPQPPPLGTMLVGPATSERVRTVCRKPRAKAMQQKTP